MRVIAGTRIGHLPCAGGDGKNLDALSSHDNLLRTEHTIYREGGDVLYYREIVGKTRVFFSRHYSAHRFRRRTRDRGATAIGRNETWSNNDSKKARMHVFLDGVPTVRVVAATCSSVM